jgi:pimeloyl-ACP methyl ester carboxylesterase
MVSPCAGRAARKADQRDLLLLLHGSAGSSALWRPLQAKFSDLYEVMAPDLLGYGTGPAARMPFTLDQETARVSDLLPCCEREFHVVGYSYGGAVALQLALANPIRIRTLTLIEPVLFATLRHGDERDALRIFSGVREKFTSALKGGDRDGAMRDFIDFWTGSGSWDRMSEQARKAALAMADKIRLDWEASFSFDPQPSALEHLASRTLIVRGDRSPQAMLTLVDSLHGLMPGSSQVVIQGANHLLPMTHGTQLAGVLVAHLHAAAERRLP